MIRPAAAALALVWGLWAADAAAEPALEPPPGSRQALDVAARAFERARALYRAGDYRGAIGELREAVRLDPGGKDLVYNLAILHEKLGELDAALEHFRRYLEMETSPAERERIEAAVRRLEGARAVRGGDEPGALAEWRDDPHEPREPTAERASRVDGWVVGSAAVAATALVVGVVFGFRALARQPGDEATGVRRSAEDLRRDQRSAHQLAVVADVAFAVAAVSGATAGVLYAVREPSPDPSAGRGVVVGVGGAF